MASGTVYRRVLASGSASWVAHATWQEGGKRRQAKRSFDTKKQAQAAVTGIEDQIKAHENLAKKITLGIGIVFCNRLRDLLVSLSQPFALRLGLKLCFYAQRCQHDERDQGRCGGSECGCGGEGLLG